MSGFSNPLMILKVVVFPQPLGPSSVTKSFPYRKAQIIKDQIPVITLFQIWDKSMSGCSIPFSLNVKRFHTSCFCVFLNAEHGFFKIRKTAKCLSSIFTHCFPVLSIDFSCFFLVFEVCFASIHPGVFRFQLTNVADYDKMSTSMNLRNAAGRGSFSEN